jgi:hypothetical protein
MPSLSGLTLTQLRATTVAAIRTAMKARIDLLTKRQLTVLELWVREFDVDAPLTLDDDSVVTTRPDRQAESQTTVQRDALGVKVGSRRVTWEYFPSGEIQTITVTDRDAADAQVARRTIRHFLDGQQPSEVRA